MGIIPLQQPQFLAGNINDVKFHKLKFIRKDGQAIHQLGNISRNTYDVELICVSNEDKDNWIGNYAEGYGFFGVKFRKSDCRDATEDEVQQWMKTPDTVKYDSGDKL